MAPGSKYEGGCFAIMASEIGRTGEMEKLLLLGVTNRTVPATFRNQRYIICNMYKLLLLTAANNVFKTIGMYNRISNAYIVYNNTYFAAAKQ